MTRTGNRWQGRDTEPAQSHAGATPPMGPCVMALLSGSGLDAAARTFHCWLVSCRCALCANVESQTCRAHAAPRHSASGHGRWRHWALSRGPAALSVKSTGYFKRSHPLARAVTLRPYRVSHLRRLSRCFTARAHLRLPGHLGAAALMSGQVSARVQPAELVPPLPSRRCCIGAAAPWGRASREAISRGYHCQCRTWRCG